MSASGEHQLDELRPSLTETAAAVPSADEHLEGFTSIFDQGELETLPGAADDSRAVEVLGEASVPRQLGRYVVLSTLGRGAMGTVLEAFDRTLDRRVAVKVLHRTVDARHATRLTREAQAMAQLSHPNVVQVYEVGRAGGQTFVAMELIEGETLEALMEQRRWPAWRRWVEVFIQLGQGLAAAHSRGLVHRDFKPSNAIIDQEDRAVVLDFGLARKVAAQPEDERSAPEPLDDAGTDAPDAPSRGGASTSGASRLALVSDEQNALDATLTRTGARVGTPAYMSLEQMYGKEADARSDQFSFCVSLWEAVYGQRPYRGDSIGTLLGAMVDGQIAPAPANTTVPRSLRRVLLRGLAAEPDERWPSMEVLLDELRSLVAPRRRRWLALLPGVVLGAIGVGVVYELGTDEATAPDRRCTGAQTQLAGIWDDERRATVQRAILDTQLSYAGETWSQVEAKLDDYVEGWTGQYVEACEATVVFEEQSERDMDLRLGCLRAQRASVRASVDVLSRADPQVVNKAAELLEDLPSVARCDDVERIAERRLRVPPPEDEAVARRVDALHQRLEDSHALGRAGVYGEALTIVEQAVSDAPALEYPPLLAEARFTRGVIYEVLGRYDDAEQDLDRAYTLAFEFGYDELALEAAIHLILVVGVRQARHAEGIQWSKTALPLAGRVGEPAHTAQALVIVGNILQARGQYVEAEARFREAQRISDDSVVAGALATVFEAQGKYEDAEVYLRRTLQASVELRGAHHPDVATSMNNLGSVLYRQDEYGEAERMIVGAQRILEEAFGKAHPSVATTANNLGTMLQRQGRADEARAQFRRALQILEEALGKDHRSLAYTLVGLARAAVDAQDMGAAREYVERVISFEDSELLTPTLLAEAHFILAQTLWSDASARDRARALAEQSRDVFAAAGPDHADKLDGVARWLSEHPAP